MSKQNEIRPQLTLYRGFPERGCYVWSPFVTKLELSLRLCNYGYKVETGSAKTGPKGKIPYIELRGDDGSITAMGDSTLIVKHLRESGYLDNPYASTQETTARAQDVAIRAMLEDRLYFYHVS